MFVDQGQYCLLTLSWSVITVECSFYCWLYPFDGCSGSLFRSLSRISVLPEQRRQSTLSVILEGGNQGASESSTAATPRSLVFIRNANPNNGYLPYYSITSLLLVTICESLSLYCRLDLFVTFPTIKIDLWSIVVGSSSSWSWKWFSSLLIGKLDDRVIWAEMPKHSCAHYMPPTWAVDMVGSCKRLKTSVLVIEWNSC